MCEFHINEHVFFDKNEGKKIDFTAFVFHHLLYFIRGVSMKKIILLMYVMVIGGFYPASALKFDIPKPSATIKDFDISAITLRDVTFLFNVTVKNPYPVPLKLQGVKLKFSVEGKQFFETETSKGFKIKAKGEADNKFTVNIKYADIIAILKDYSQKEFLQTTIDTEIIVPVPDVVKTPLLPEQFSFKYSLSKRIPALKPHVSVVRFKVVEPSIDEVKTALKKAGKNVDPKKAAGMIGDILAGKKPEQIVDPASLDLKIRVNFDIELRNESKSKLSFSSLDYNFFVNSSALVSGNTASISSSGEKQVLTVSNAFSTKALAGPVLNAFKKKSGAFLVKGNTMIQLPADIKKTPLKLTFFEGGDFSI
jgi:LEA14-like dessication related protein